MIQWKKHLPPELAEQILPQVPLASKTSFRIGGPADWFYEPLCKEDLLQVLHCARACSCPVTLIGNGSNLLVADQGIRGLVLSLGRKYTNIEEVKKEEEQDLLSHFPHLLSCCESYPNTPLYVDLGHPPCLLRVQAGTALARVAHYAKDRGLAGLEFACGIPGTVGGGVFMNAGAYGNSLEDVVVLTEALTWDGRKRMIVGADHDFDYRSSYFSKAGQIILESYFCLRPGRRGEIQNLQEEYNRRRNTTQPLELPSAGSMFKRPQGYFAGKLISDAGLKGYRVGDAAVSEKHAGFVVNLGRARAEDVRELVRRIQVCVFEKFSVQLEPEVRFIGDWEESQVF